jgi:hypothetical protein
MEWRLSKISQEEKYCMIPYVESKNVDLTEVGSRFVVTTG